MKMYLISDNIDTLTGMRLAGVEGAVVHKREELKEELEVVVGLVERCVTEDLAERGLTYAELVSIQRDTSGAIVSLTTDMAAMNLLRAELVERVLDALEGVGVLQLRIPLGSLLDLDVLWGLGPSLKVHAMAVGTADARFSSSFSEAGVNQTLHRIELELTVPMTLLLPGGPVETESVTRLCVAETVIVGRVPDAYLQMERSGGG